MTRAVERAEYIAGFQAPIHRGIWERILTMGAPRMWTTLWLACCLFVGLLFLLGRSPKLIVVAGLVWGVGQAGLVLLTLFDGSWDAIVVAHLSWHGTRWGYQSFYDAG